MNRYNIVSLCQKSLKDLPKGVVRPLFERSSLSPAIVHIGVGNFHRAHQSWYLQQLMQRGEALDWAIIGAGVKSCDHLQRQKLVKQDCLTTLIELDPSGSRVEVVGSMIDYLPVDETNSKLIKCLARPDIRIVSLTVTEGGYFLNNTTNFFDENHPDIIYDSKVPDNPKTAFGAIVAALKIRWKSGYGPLTALSCDNLEGNGDALRNAVLGLANLSDPDLANWIKTNCTFPNSMVDCIVPRTGPTEIKLSQRFGINDRVPVTHENFRQWVIEDKFCLGRPNLEDVGVTFASDIKDYEQMKIRILNGGHQVVAGCGEMLSIETISGCMENRKIDALLSKIILEEIAPHVQAVPDMDPVSYFHEIKLRFSNPKILDTTRRVSSNGSTYHPGFIFPSIWDGLRSGAPIEGLALVEAIWARMAEGTREDGSEIEPKDDNWEKLQKSAILAKSNPMVWLNMREIYAELSDQPRFAKSFSTWLKLIWSDGIEAAISTFTET